MEQEELYKAAHLKINDLTAALNSLNQFSFAKALSDAKKDIDNHFEILFKALQQRKEELIKTVDKLSQELQNKIEAEKKELTKMIQASNKVIEGGVLLYDFRREVALEMWEKIQKVVYKKAEKKGVQVDFLSLLETIKSHGIVSTEAVSQKSTGVRTLAGSTEGNDDGQGVNAKFTDPCGIMINPVDDCLYVCDGGNNMIRQVTKLGNVSKFIDCPVPVAIAFYQKDQCYFVAEWQSHSIKRISLKGEVSTYAGSGNCGYQDGERMNAMFNCPWGIAVNQDTGDVYISDYENHIIRKITPQGQVSTLAGTPEKYGHSDGIQSTLFNHPCGICFHSQQQALIVCDTVNDRLRKILLDGTVTTICEINRPDAVSVLSNESVLVSSIQTHQILKIYINDSKAETEVFAGSGNKGYKDGASLESEFNFPMGIAIDHKSNNCFVVDYGNLRIRAIHYYK